MLGEKLPPPSGFFSPDFWVSLLTVVSTFILSQCGISAAFLQSLPGGDSWLPILIVILICLYMVISTYLKTRRARIDQSLPASSKIDIKTRTLIETSEFWLGLTVVAIKILQEYNVIGGALNSSVTTTFLILAVVYALSRSQLKQAYLKSLLFKVTKPDSDEPDSNQALRNIRVRFDATPSKQ